MKNKKIIIAGGSGFIGQELAKRWGKENHIIILSRQSSRAKNNTYGQQLLTAADGYNITYWHWDGRTIEKHWTDELEGCDLVINLAGRTVNCRYTAKNRQEILDSRIDATKALGQAISRTTVPPKLWINASSATIYRHAEDRPQDEMTGEDADDFSVMVCKKWEQELAAQRTPFTRKIALRMAIALGNGGIIPPYLRLLKTGLGGRQGNGRQFCSWVHIDDIGRVMEWLLQHPEKEGTYNLAAPGPVTNAHFMSALRKTTGIPFGLPLPSWLLGAAAALIGTSTELLLKSRWVLPTRLLREGFVFRYPRLEDALPAVLG